MIMSLKSKVKVKWITVASIIWLVLWLAFVDPRKAAPIFLLVPLALIFFLIYRLVVWVTKKMSSDKKLTRRQSALDWFISILAGLLLVFGSLGQLDWRDGLTLLAIAAIGLVYIIKLVPSLR